jgi:rhodanese-related sulfurtransferase
MKRAVVIGAGLIGLETAEALAMQGLEVTVVEALDWVLPTLLDFEVAAYVARHLRDKGVNLKFGERVLGFEGDGQGWVRRVMTRDGELDAGLVLLAIGVRPNTALAGEAGLDTGPAGGISVNRYLQTSDGDIYAGGDCVENINLITGQPMLAPLGSTANKQGRVIGSNATGGSDTFPGVLGTAVVKVFDCNVGRVGLSQWQAEQAGYQVSASLVPSHDHATYYPGSKEIMVKLVADKATRRLLGGQVTGPGEAAKRIDVLATALSFGATVDDLSNLDLAYAPPYNSALDPLHHAANVIRNKQSGQARALTPMAVKQKLDQGDDFILLDVRSPQEWETSHLEAARVKQLPLTELRDRLAELPRDAEIVTFCRSSIRAYQAQRILDSAGFDSALFMDGSLAGWPYEVVARPAKRQDIDAQM